MRRAMRGLADVDNPQSLSNRMRRRRFLVFRQMVDARARPVTILDVGGRESYWERAGMCGEDGVRLVLLNREAPLARHEGVETVVGDATNMPEFSDGQFDIVFSNSVIEHVGDLAAQRRMAAEIRRVGRSYYVQTPSRWFPIEPHYLFPFFGVLPLSVRAFLIRHLSLGWRPRVADREGSYEEARSVRLLTRRELGALFPDAVIHPERIAGITKSFVAIGQH